MLYCIRPIGLDTVSLTDWIRSHSLTCCCCWFHTSIHTTTPSTHPCTRAVCIPTLSAMAISTTPSCSLDGGMMPALETIGRSKTHGALAGARMVTSVFSGTPHSARSIQLLAMGWGAREGLRR
jgi:hypothetical protein